MPPRALRESLIKTIAVINDLTAAVNHTTHTPSAAPHLLNLAVTDGHTVVCTRYVSSKTDEAASLFFSSGSSFDEYQPGMYRMERRDRGQDIVMVASEPLTFERADWVTVPTNSKEFYLLMLKL